MPKNRWSVQAEKGGMLTLKIYKNMNATRQFCSRVKFDAFYNVS